jgi:hypothetical protein
MSNSRPMLERRYDDSLGESLVGSDMDRLTSGLGVDGSLGHYNEEAFRYFLDVERKRAELSGRPFLLLLIDLKKMNGVDAAIERETAQTISGALAACVRDTDFLGWYREGRVVGAVLTQHGEAVSAGMTELVTGRVDSALRGTLPPETSDRIQLRVYQLPPNPGRQGQE